ncbi:MULTISPECIES: hypothetical protein [Myxococcus]|uniref:hypothetical protein n=1 Tax=Myxococcus TaxID=32 RepID=UPI001FE56D73|nr:MULTISPECIES: hypothetical protein [Myxococcus]
MRAKASVEADVSQVAVRNDSGVTGTGRPARRVARSVGAVLAGLLVNALLSTGTDAVLHATGIYPPVGQPMSDALFGLATAYRVVFGILGFYVTARLAPDRPMRHVLWLGVVGLALSTLGAVATWGKGPEFGPTWYPLLLIATVMPCAWVGGRLGEARLSAARRA